MKTAHQIGHWIGVSLIFAVLVFVTGCGKKEPPVLSLYCSVSHLPVAEKLVETFYRVYGVTAICIPIDDATYAAFSLPEPEETDSITIKNRYETRKEAVFASGRIQRLKSWIKNAAYKDFPQYLVDSGLGGDLFLCDSPAEVQRLRDFDLLQRDQPLAFLTPVLIVRPESGPLYSVEDILKSSESLGIVRREVNGLGHEVNRFLQNLLQKDPSLSMDSVVVFDNETILLQAWEEKQITAAICWDSTASRVLPEVEPLALPRTDVLAVPLTMCDLKSGADYFLMEFFSIFAFSPSGQSLFKQFGYKTR